MRKMPEACQSGTAPSLFQQVLVQVITSTSEPHAASWAARLQSADVDFPPCKTDMDHTGAMYTPCDSDAAQPCSETALKLGCSCHPHLQVLPRCSCGRHVVRSDAAAAACCDTMFAAGGTCQHQSQVVLL